MNVFKSMIIALSMYSKIPVPKMEWTEENMRYTMCFFPLVGAVIGLLEWIWFDISFMLEAGDILRSVGLVLIPVLITGGIHLDGLLDTADAISSYQTQEKRLEIMKDTHAGAFAIIVCCVYFLAYFGVLTQVNVQAIYVLGLGFILSRALSGFGVASFPLAKGSGLVYLFADRLAKKKVKIVLVIESLLLCVGMVEMDLALGMTAAIVAALFLGIYRIMTQKIFGGITGDTQGFFLQLCELFMAVAVTIVQLVVY
ncbi:cobalamin-5'-phosphate synthase [Eubacterium oxidoreducens]|uniref:Adenosylcobinamide-GDP ribazoletransferase n=2 Tax=Eubacterium oxidoreducens TaxID=1732 RepID=A0A1G6BI39_EUBOX|nr:cobalamin-5'-phosphate synthase [Eubacterium oxidoreducens]